MPRFSVALNDETNEWVEQQANERDRSKSSLVAAIVEAARADEFDPFAERGSSRTTPNRLDELEARVEDLEDALDDVRAPPPARSSPPARETAEATDADETGSRSEDDDTKLELGETSTELDQGLLARLEDYLDERPPHKTHGKRAAVATVLALREEGTMSTGDLQEAVYGTGDLAEHYTDARTLWNSISRYLDDVPGVEKAGYGEWRYTGDDVLAAAVAE